MDLIVYIAIALFIILRLRSILGETDKTTFSERTKQKPIQTILGNLEQDINTNTLNSGKQDNVKKEKEETLENEFKKQLSQSSIEALNKISEKNSNFAITDFIKGAEQAFEMLLKAFINNDTDTLKLLLSDKLYNKLVRQINKLEKQKEINCTTLISIKSININEIKINKNNANITITFETEQIPMFKNEKQEIIRGDPKNIVLIEDKWTLERNINSPDPNWKIVALN